MSPDLHHLSGAYAVDALDDAERASFEQHLAVCADCRAEVAELSAAAGSLASLVETTPPPSLRASVLSGIGQVRPLPPLTEDAGAPAGDDAPDSHGKMTSRKTSACLGRSGPRLSGRSRHPEWNAASALSHFLSIFVMVLVPEESLTANVTRSPA